MSAPVAVALSRDVPPGTSIGVRVQEREYVVWRDTSGKAHIWEDRCPHRGMKLSLGFVRGDHIACLYHGWEYDAEGTCQKIPAHPDLPVPPSICVETFAVAECGGLIWLGSSEGMQWPDDTGYTPVRSMMVDAPPAAFDCPDGVHVEVQPVSESQTMLHILVDERSSPQEAFTWSQALRVQLESASV